MRDVAQSIARASERILTQSHRVSDRRTSLNFMYSSACILRRSISTETVILSELWIRRSLEDGANAARNPPSLRFKGRNVIILGLDACRKRSQCSLARKKVLDDQFSLYLDADQVDLHQDTERIPLSCRTTAQVHANFNMVDKPSNSARNWRKMSRQYESRFSRRAIVSVKADGAAILMEPP
ncbi:hypothetical protein F444_08293 [Phytophthora nicotianae P1976]|uniref:Uncharacterized protein n=1 Tax=Phytophthora nicotianae P1976 TaxID=1317066 RepID=A0A081ABL7_PHYNI|nr:hypothetical protein F444_08293 [Phytophthora nicotianae P1976]